MLAEGLSADSVLQSALQAICNVCPEVRAAILVIREDVFVIAAGLGLTPDDHEFLAELNCSELTSVLEPISGKHGVHVRPLITNAAEIVGTLVILNQNAFANSNACDRQIEVASVIATLAIEQKQIVEELSYRALHDPLTHLWNRTRIEEEIAASLAFVGETYTGVIIVGLDSFQLVNELLGAEAGDELLRQTAARLTQAAERGFSVGRGSGDEFIILMRDLVSRERVKSFSSEIMIWFEKPFLVADHELGVRASIGFSVVKAGERDAGALLTQAGSALRYGKKNARGRSTSFDQIRNRNPPERLLMESHLRFALQKREFVLAFQPQVELASGKLTGVEALLRWRHASIHFISPASFIPIAEEIGLIEEIGEWVLGESIRQLEVFQRSGFPDLRMAVNVSALQFSRQDIASSVAKALRVAGIRPEHLELEITETAVMADFDRGIKQMKLLRSLGIQLALDDFGTGHSSLAYLTQIPVQRLKIDRMFVKEIVSELERPPLLTNIVQIGREMGYSVLCEGVETQEQASALRGMGCHEAQGFLFAKALAPEEFLTWAADYQPA